MSKPVPHYVCSGGCLTIQAEKGYCQTKDCPRYRNPLSLCDCTDGKHTDWLFRNNPDPESARAAAKSKLTKLSFPTDTKSTSETKTTPKPKKSRSK